MKQKVLVIDDEPDIRELLEITLGRMGLDARGANDLAAGRRLLREEHFHLCLTDMRLPDGNGIDLVREIQEQHPELPVAVITAHGSTEAAISALKAGAFDFVSKPIDLVKLRALIGAALKLSDEETRATQEPSRSDFPVQIIGESDHIRHLKVQISKVARSQAPVFISGESGSGKELVARAIHYAGPRKEGAFVAINCGAIPAELMESEFFGHRKGSFAGADLDKAGLFQAAHGGTLFLDEIADLPLHMQVKLLRALQDKSIRPVGSQNDLAVDVRLISATHRNLAEEVERGRLRQDLYYRVNVIELKVPPLRERRGDIPLLARHILERLAREVGSAPAEISQHALNQLMSYDFPGNVRELENLLQRACALADNHRIVEFDLPRQSRLPPDEDPDRWMEEVMSEAAEDFSPETGYSLEKHLENIEKQAIRTALEESRWNKTEAARKLGMSFRSFRYRVKKLGLD